METCCIEEKTTFYGSRGSARRLAKDMNDYFLNPTREAYTKGRRMSDTSVYRIRPGVFGFDSWVESRKVSKEDVDTLARECQNLGVDTALLDHMGNLVVSQLPHNKKGHIKNLTFN